MINKILLTKIGGGLVIFGLSIFALYFFFKGYLSFNSLISLIKNNYLLSDRLLEQLNDIIEYRNNCLEQAQTIKKNTINWVISQYSNRVDGVNLEVQNLQKNLVLQEQKAIEIKRYCLIGGALSVGAISAGVITTLVLRYII